MSETLASIALPHAACAAVYLALAVLVLVQAARGGRVSLTAVLLAVAALATAAWAASALWQLDEPLGGVAGSLDLVRATVWYGFILHLFRAAEPADTAARRDRLDVLFVAIGVVAALGVAAAILFGRAGSEGVVSLTSPAVALRLMLALGQLLLIENLYRNTEPDSRWNVGLACIGLGGLAAFDVMLCANAALLHGVSPVLAATRPVVAILVCPLLAVAAARNRSWSIDIHVSRSAALHTATLVVSGVFLLAVAAVGLLARRYGGAFGTGWGNIAQISLIFGGTLGAVVLLLSGSARSRVRLAFIDHFFTNRYDYRREWMRCINTLSDEAAYGTLPDRAVRAVAQVVDSPAGMLLLREPGALGLHWAGSWNMPQLTAPLPPDHPLLAALGGARDAVPLTADSPAWAPLGRSLDLWLVIPLRLGDAIDGCVLVARPRAPFRLDHEVFALLRIVAREVATYLAEQRATRVLLETRELRAYGERFAFVAHDIKNVSSQLSLLLSNAETHIANPEFQRDMLVTVAASVQKIGTLIRRLQTPEPAAAAAPPPAPLPSPEGEPKAAIFPVIRLEALARRVRALRGTPVVVDHDGGDAAVAMEAATFDTVVTHLLDNAIEAAGADREVRLCVRHQLDRVIVDVTDSGPGMPPEFIRDQLFRPFHTSKRQGSGIGAFQARALLREAAGDLQVVSTPGQGTTMRLLLPLAPTVPVAISA